MSVDLLSCNASTGYTITEARIYIHLPDQLARGSQSSYQAGSNYKLAKADIDALSLTGTYNIDFIYLVSYLASNSSKTILYDYMVRSVNIYKSPMPLVVALVGYKDLS